MSLTLYAHPFASYCQKVLVALYENDVPFEYRTLEDPSAMAELKVRWPFARFPILVDDGRTIVESTQLDAKFASNEGPTAAAPRRPSPVGIRESGEATFL